MSEAKERTAEQVLLEKHAAARRRVEAEKRAEPGPQPISRAVAARVSEAAKRPPDEGGPSGPVFATVTRPCPECGADVDVPAFMPRPLRCARCSAAEQERQEREAERKRRAERAMQILPLLEQVGVSAREHGGATLEDFDPGESGTAPVHATRAFVDEVLAAGPYDPVRGLYLWGPTGTGKSHLAAAAVRELLLYPQTNPDAIRWDHALDLMAQIQDTYGSDDSTVAALRLRYRAHVWVLDDLGTERASEDVARHLTLIVTKRAQWPTIITSNYSPSDLEAQRPELGRVCSRLGPAYFRAVEVRGRDRRFG